MKKGKRLYSKWFYMDNKKVNNRANNHNPMVMVMVFVLISGLAIISVVGVTLDSLKVSINKDRVESFSQLSEQSSKMLDETIVSAKEYSKLFAESFGSDYNINTDMYDYFQNKTKELCTDNSVFLLVDSTSDECFTSAGNSFTIFNVDENALDADESVIIDYLQGPPEPKYLIFVNTLNSPVFANYRDQSVKITHSAVAISMDYIIMKADSNIPADVNNYIVNQNNEVVCSRIITDFGLNGNDFFTESFINMYVKSEDRDSFAQNIKSGEPFTYEFNYKGKLYTVGIFNIGDTDMKYVVVLNNATLGDPVDSALYRIITLYTVVVALLGFCIFFITFYFKKSKIDKELLAENEEIREKLEKNLKIVAIQKNELEKQQDALEEALKMANSASRAKTAFLSNMSHDIRTPMNAIMGYTTLASSNIDNIDKVKDYLGKIESSSTHLLSLINEILDMSSIESGIIEINYEEEKLSEIVSTIHNLIETETMNKKQSFVIEENQIHDVVYCDRLRLEQVLLNVLTNSSKYTKEGGTIKLIINEKPINELRSKFEIQIIDNGVGMNEEFVRTIFDPFTRENSSTLSGVDGTGLGMAIVAKIVEKMFGSCNIESKENVGTKVTLCFDFDVVSEEKTEIAGTENADFTGKKVLIVEDNKLNAEIAEEILNEHGFETDIVDDGSVAVERMEEVPAGTYDAILMDIQMPIMDGYEATRKIRAMEDKAKSSIPIIAMTANAFEEDIKMAFAAGMNKHVAKPVDIKILMDALQGVLFKC